MYMSLTRFLCELRRYSLVARPGDLFSGHRMLLLLGRESLGHTFRPPNPEACQVLRGLPLHIFQAHSCLEVLCSGLSVCPPFPSMFQHHPFLYVPLVHDSRLWPSTHAFSFLFLFSLYPIYLACLCTCTYMPHTFRGTSKDNFWEPVLSEMFCLLEEFVSSR